MGNSKSKFLSDLVLIKRIRKPKNKMSLFCGNISKNVKMSELEDEFMKFGKCEIRNKVCFFT